MPYTTELTRDCLGAVHSGSGLVTGDDLLAASIAVRRLVQNTENFQYEFVDFSDVTEMRIEPDDLDKIVEQDRLAAQARPRAIVVIVAPQEFAYEVARQWEEKVKDLGWTTHIERERTEGVRWLVKHLKTERPELLAEKRESAV